MRLILVKRGNPYTKLTPNHCLRRLAGALLSSSCVPALPGLMDEIGAWGQIEIVSGWRSQEEQEQIYNDSLTENGSEFTAKYVALPGHSEHQIGLAVDLALSRPDIDTLRPHFPYTGICGTFRAKAAEYGFIERYPQGKESITGIAHEPWHFRYVGTPHAAIMTQMGFTLEEYLKWMENR